MTMHGRRFKRQRAGQPIAARTINVPLAEVERLSRAWAAAPFTLTDGPHGRLLRLSPRIEFWAMLTSGSNPYVFVEVYAAAFGTWTVAPVGLSGSAYEVNGNASLTTPLYVRIRQSAAGDFRFEGSACP